MIVSARQVNAESIPRTSMTISQMGFEPRHKIRGQSYIVELVFPIQGVDARFPLD